MPIQGFLKLPDIDGESQTPQHEGEIDVWGVEWSIDVGASSVGRFARSRARSDMGPLVVHKFYDKSSPKIAQAIQQQRRLNEVTFTATSQTEVGSLDYLIITMENVMISDYRMHQIERDGDATFIEEIFALEFQSVDIKHIAVSETGTAEEETNVKLSESRFS